MRYSQAFIPTVKEVPKDATMPSHILMLRGGYARMVGAGIYELLPLGTRVLHNIATIVREEMDNAGAQELLMPAILPSEYFKESGRWDVYGQTLFRLQDRKGGEYHLGPTHEEIITDLVRREVKSYRQLPLNLYQIQSKYRDEPRPRAGLLRCREFLMKDAYSFDVSADAAEQSYASMRDAYHRIFQRLGLAYRIVEADSGAIGGSQSAEFQVLAQTGEDSIAACENCDYAANVEAAEPALADSTPLHAAQMLPSEELKTPKVKSIADVVEFLGDGLTAAGMLKSLLYLAGEETVLAVVRGDHEVNETALAKVLGVDNVTLASETTVKEVTGTPPGFLGPAGHSGRIVADLAVAHVLNAVSGANKAPFHVRNINYGRDFDAELAPIRLIAEGDPCPACKTPLKLYRGIEGGHIFILGTHYSDKMNATFLDENGESVSFVMGCYGIGVSRLVATIIEQHHDDNGIVWPIAVAPYQVIVTPIGKDAEPFEKAEQIYESIKARGISVLLDDRQERPGVKFKDADLIGIPLRITIGARSLQEGAVELKARRHKDATNVQLSELDTAIDAALAALRA